MIEDQSAKMQTNAMTCSLLYCNNKNILYAGLANGVVEVFVLIKAWKIGMGFEKEKLCSLN